MKKFAKILFIIVFFGICAVPMIAMPFVKSNAELEKRQLQEFPNLISEGQLNTNYSTSFEKWLNDHLPYRAQLLTAANFVKVDMFSAASSNVIAGSDGYFFFQSTVADYMNTNAMSEYELQSVVTTLSLIQESVKAKGGNFLFAPMPNKNEIYGEYMPLSYQKADENNLSRLYTAMSERNVNYVNMVEVLKEAKETSQVYHKKDTHWNYQGAYIGYKALMEALPHEANSYSEESHIEHNWESDMIKMVYPAGGVLDDQVIFDNRTYEEFNFTSPKMNLSTEEELALMMSDKEDNDTLISTEKVNKLFEMRLYMVRDSFGRALLPYMIDSYDYATFERTTVPTIATLEPGTDVIYEIGERNLANVISSAPYLMAPEREQVTVNQTKDYENNWMMVQEEGYGCRIFGVLDDEMLSSDARVYIKLSNEDNEYYYEAFPIYEKSLIEKSGNTPNTKNGFSLMLDNSKIKKGTYDIQIISNGTMTTSLAKQVLGAESEETPEQNPDTFEKQEVTGDYSKDLQVIYQGVTFGVNDNADEVVKKLGKQSRPSSTVMQCAYPGIVTGYYYDGMEIWELDGKIITIQILGDKAATVTGVTVGLTKQEIIALFGTPSMDWDFSVRYTKGNLDMDVIYDNDGKCNQIEVSPNASEMYENATEASNG